MQPFYYDRPQNVRDASRLATETQGAVLYAGGTTLYDLMKLNVIRPTRLVDITQLNDESLGGIEVRDNTLRFGALVSMATAAEHPEVKARAPVLSESLWLAASPQIRHMARLGGNVLQHTRCPYYRDPTWQACNKRNPGSGCAALDGVNRLHAVLGTSDACIAMYPGDWAQGLIAFDAQVEVEGPEGARVIPFAKLHRLPGDTPHIQTALKPGELIRHIVVPLSPALERSIYIKARDRESYAFANASAAVGLVLEDDGETVSDVRIGLGGVATVPWRARETEESLKGKPLTPENVRAAAEAAFTEAHTFEHNAFKVPLGINVIVKALTTLKQLEA
jgi:xanthine dehydrogenase YagS FAD-binding subunit